MEQSSMTNDNIEPIINDKMEESDTVIPKMKELDILNDAVNGEISEVEDLDISESEEASPLENVPLNIDVNARIVTKEVKCDNEGDDCDMQFVEKNSTYLLSHRGSEAGIHTDTEDLNVSDDEQSCVSALQAVNLDGLASTSTEKDINLISTSNFSHTVFKDEFSFEAEYLSDEEIRSALKEKSGGEDKLSQVVPELKLEGLLLTFRPPPSFFSPATPDALDNFSVNNVSPSSMTDKSDSHDFDDDPDSPSQTGFDLIKSEYLDDHNTDAEDISFGSLDDIIESSKKRNLFGKRYNAFSLPETVSVFSCENSSNARQFCPGDKRSTVTEILTDDETLTLENFPDHGKKRVKKFNFRVTDKNEKSDDTLTDEEDIEDQ